MSRAFKFRAWDGENMLNIDHWTVSMLNEHIPKGHVVMQCAEYEDYENTEIFGGDIIRYSDLYDSADRLDPPEPYSDVGEVLWDNELLAWGVAFANGGDDFLADLDPGHIRIIGNIHEHANLLEK